MPVADVLEFCDLFAHFVVGNDVVSAINCRRNAFHLVPQGQVVFVQSAELCCTAVCKFADLLGEFNCPVSAVRPVRTIDSVDAEFLTVLLHCIHFSIGIRCVAIDGHNSRNTKLCNVAQVPTQVPEAFLERRHVFGAKVRLRNATLHLESLDRCHEHDSIRLQPSLTALDVEELLRTKIGPKAGFRYDVIRQFQSGCRRHHRVTAVCDVRKRTAVHQRRIVFDRLHEVWLQRILEQRSHRPLGVQLPDCDRLVLARIAKHDIAETLLEVLEIRREAEDRHDFGRDRDIETGFAHNAIVVSAETRRDRA